MFKTVIAFIIIMTSAIVSFSQDSDDYKKNEVFVGGVIQSIESADRQIGFGAEGSYVRNVHRYFGFKADFSAAGGGESTTVVNGIAPVTGGTAPYSLRITQKTSIYNVLGGIQVKDNSREKKIKPFVHALAGIQWSRDRFDFACTSGNCVPALLNSFNFHDRRLGVAVGGGLDVKVNDKISIRVFQVDYNPGIYLDDVQQNFRFGAGIVF